MKWFNKMKKNLGILAIFGLLFQTALPIYQNAAFAQENEAVEQEQLDEMIDEISDLDNHLTGEKKGTSSVEKEEPELDTLEEEEELSENKTEQEKKKADADLNSEEEEEINKEDKQKKRINLTIKI